MYKRAIAVFLLLLFMLFLVGCSAHIHKVGNGPAGNDMMQQRQWYVLFGLVPINDVDTHQMAGGATDYQIKTEQSALDVLINIFTGVVSVYSRTVTVTK
jgi:hypothetical protein